MGVRARVRVRRHDELSEVMHFCYIMKYFIMLWRTFLMLWRMF